jgi:hypothetical protein
MNDVEFENQQEKEMRAKHPLMQPSYQPISSESLAELLRQSNLSQQEWDSLSGWQQVERVREFRSNTTK